MTERLYQLDTGFACGGLVFDDRKCIECAPIFKKWFLLRCHGTCIQIIRNKNWKLTKIR